MTEERVAYDTRVVVPEIEMLPIDPHSRAMAALVEELERQIAEALMLPREALNPGLGLTADRIAPQRSPRYPFEDIVTT